MPTANESMQSELSRHAEDFRDKGQPHHAATMEQFSKALASLPTPENIDAGVIAVKELRRDLDAQLQKLRGLPASRERSLCVTKLQEAIMWLGMDLKRLASLRPDPVAPTKTIRELAREAYHRYGAVTEFKNFKGDPMPEFDALPPTIVRAWEASVSADNGRPYPLSYDPSTTKVDATAEGLKL